MILLFLVSTNNKKHHSLFRQQYYASTNVNKKLKELKQMHFRFIQFLNLFPLILVFDFACSYLIHFDFMDINIEKFAFKIQFIFPYNSYYNVFRNLTREYFILNKKRRDAMCLTYLGYKSSNYTSKS